MHSTVDVSFASTTANTVDLTVNAHTVMSAPSFPTPGAVPAALSEGQAYYWRYSWQVGERQSRRELAAGKGKTFDTADAPIRWLLSDDE
jgi:hypothetical protein